MICDLALPNLKSRLRLCIKQYAIRIPDTGRCILLFRLYFYILLQYCFGSSRAVAYNIAKVQSNKIYVALLPV